MAGRPRKTEAEHRLHGTVSQAKPVQASPIIGGRPRFRRDASPRARREFKRIVKLLEDRGTVTPADQDLIALYADVFDRYLACKEEIGSRLMVEVTVCDSNGEAHKKSVVHPLLKVLQSCESRMAQLIRELSLTPLARDKARVTSESKDRDIVPGSLAETHPELMGKVLTMPTAEELASADDSENAEKF